MDHRRLFSDIQRRPRAYGLSGRFREYVAFIQGCDAGNDWGLLVGFPEWLALKTDRDNSAVWPSLVLVASGASTVSLDKIEADEEEHATETLFSLLDDFLSEKTGAKGASTIIARYAVNRERRFRDEHGRS